MAETWDEEQRHYIDDAGRVRTKLTVGQAAGPCVCGGLDLLAESSLGGETPWKAEPTEPAPPIFLSVST